MSSESVHESTATRATAYAGASATDYAHAGRGPTVVLIGSRLDHPLFTALAAQFRVVAPHLPCRAADPGADAPAPPFSAWLRDFLDCLGIARASLVIEEPFGVGALQFCLTDATRVDRVVLLIGDATDPTVADDVVLAVLGSQQPAFTTSHRGGHAP